MLKLRKYMVRLLIRSTGTDAARAPLQRCYCYFSVMFPLYHIDAKSLVKRYNLTSYMWYYCRRDDMYGGATGGGTTKRRIRLAVVRVL